MIIKVNKKIKSILSQSKLILKLRAITILSNILTEHLIICS